MRLTVGYIPNGAPLFDPALFAIGNGIGTAAIALVLAFVFGSSSSFAPKIGISVVGWRGAAVLGFLSPWIGRPLFDAIFLAISKAISGT
jgi:hypothetical protein